MLTTAANMQNQFISYQFGGVDSTMNAIVHLSQILLELGFKISFMKIGRYTVTCCDPNSHFWTLYLPLHMFNNRLIKICLGNKRLKECWACAELQWLTDRCPVRKCWPVDKPGMVNKHDPLTWQGWLMCVICSAWKKVFVSHFWKINIFTASTKLGQGYIFTGVRDSVTRGVCLSACWDTTPPPPQDQASLPRPGTPREADTPQEQTPPRSRACWEIRSTRGRYASYWNAILSNLLYKNSNLLIKRK